MRTRAYFVTLLLFLLFFNGSIALVSVASLRSSLDGARGNSYREHSFIALAMAKDLRAVEGRGADLKSAFKPLFDSYVKYYGKQNVYLEVSANEGPHYSSVPDELGLSALQLDIDADKGIIRTLESKGKQYVCVTAALPEPYGSYLLYYYYDLSGTISVWVRTTNFLIVSGMIISALLAVCLNVLLNRVFKPLRQFAAVSQSIAGGDYASRLPALGNDELADLAKSFNHMAGEVESRIIKLADAAEQKQRFIDNLAHELRTPLTSIYGYAEYTQKTAITEEDKVEATGFIMSESRRLQGIAYRLLELASLRTGEIAFEPVDVADIFRRAGETLENLASEKGIMLEFECGFPQLTGDGDLLQSLIVNLVENAIKACGRGGKVKIRAGFKNGKKTISVQDDGKGMTQEQVRRITEAFYRVDGARSREDGGVGLGLALCEQIAVRHGAKLDFDSEPGRGTTAKVTFSTP